MNKNKLSDKAAGLLDAIGGAKEEYVEKAGRKPLAALRIYNRTYRWLIPAACLCLIAAGAVIISSYAGRTRQDIAPDGIYPEDSSAAYAEGEGVTIPKMQVSVPGGGATADMIAFFIYQGRSYSEYYRLPADRDIIGEHLGTATGSIDEWTRPDDYVELSGSIGGDFYSVKGYPPEFLLCMRMSDGSISVFVNDNGITLSKGADVFEDRMKLSENTTGVRYQSDDSWFYGKNEIYKLSDPQRAEVGEFIKALDEGDFILRAPDDGIVEGRKGHLYFDSDSGLPVDVILYDGGYAQMRGLYGVYVRYDEQKLEPLLSLFESGENAVYVGNTDSIDLTYEDCMSDPYLGQYVPRYIPDGMEMQYAVKYRVIDAGTGAVGAVKSIEIGFGGNGSYNIVITDETLQKNDIAAPIFDLDTVTIDDVEARTETTLHNDGKVKNVSTALGLRSGNCVIAVYAYGMDTKTVYEIIRSIG